MTISVVIISEVIGVVGGVITGTVLVVLEVGRADVVGGTSD
jgi:hypothetical protein